MKGKIAVVTAAGIGDGLILHIASHNLTQLGYEATTFNDHLAGFGAWLKGYSFAKQPSLGQIESIFSGYDAVILQHDNTPKAKKIRALPLPVYGFYGSHRISKHGILRESDYVCDPDRTMVENVKRAMARWFGAASKETGMSPPEGLVHRKYPLRVAIHSASGSPEKNWPQEKYVRAAEKLKKLGYDPVFLAKEEGPLLFPRLEDLASFLYESGAFFGNDSGPGHIASCLKIPSLIIGRDERQMRLWAPGWMAAEVLTPPRWSTRWNWSRNQWQQLISTKSVIKILMSRVLKN